MKVEGIIFDRDVSMAFEQKQNATMEETAGLFWETSCKTAVVWEETREREKNMNSAISYLNRKDPSIFGRSLDF